MLLFSDSTYLQVVEGGAEAVARAWSRISLDPRHQIIWSVQGTRPDRVFPGLPMGYFDADRETGRVTSWPIWRRRDDWQSEDAGRLVEMLETIAAEKYPDALRRGRED